MTTLWAVNSIVSTFQEMSETDPGGESTLAANGWNVGSEPAADMALFVAGTEVLRGTFAPGTLPDSPIVSGDSFRSTGTYSGSFASGTWAFHLRGIAVTNASGQIGRVRIRVWRSVNADGSSANEITSAVAVGTTPGAAITTSTPQTSSATFNPGTVNVTNEYLLVQTAWEVTTAASMTGADVNLRIGTGATRLITPTFTPAAATSDVPGRGSQHRHHRASSIYRTAPQRTGRLWVFPSPRIEVCACL